MQVAHWPSEIQSHLPWQSSWNPAWCRAQDRGGSGQEMAASLWLIRRLANLKLLWIPNLGSVVLWKGWRLLSTMVHWVICPWTQPPTSLAVGRPEGHAEGRVTHSSPSPPRPGS